MQALDNEPRTSPDDDGRRRRARRVLKDGGGCVRHRVGPSAARALLLLLLMVVGVRPVRGQSGADRATLVVRVVDTVGLGVIGAEVVLGRGRDERHTARADSAGATTFSEVEPGLWSLTVRRLGLRPISTVLRLAPGRNAFTVRASPAALILSGVRVVGDVPYSARLAGYTVAISTRGAKPTRNTGGAGFALVQCVMRVVVDGTLMPALFNIDEIVPRDVHGIEVYNGPSRMPPELAGLRTDSWCGVIAIWTRDK